MNAMLGSVGNRWTNSFFYNTSFEGKQTSGPVV